MSLQEIIEAARQLPPQDRQRLIETLQCGTHAEADAGGDGAQPHERSAYEKMKHLIGSVEGPPDLSTNPDHMRGFGEDSLS